MYLFNKAYSCNTCPKGLVRLKKYKNPRKTRIGQTPPPPPPTPYSFIIIFFLKHVQQQKTTQKVQKHNISKFYNLNFHPEDMSSYRDPQHQVGDNYHISV